MTNIPSLCVWCQDCNDAVVPVLFRDDDPDGDGLCEDCLESVMSAASKLNAAKTVQPCTPGDIPRRYDVTLDSPTRWEVIDSINIILQSNTRSNGRCDVSEDNIRRVMHYYHPEVTNYAITLENLQNEYSRWSVSLMLPEVPLPTVFVFKAK